MNLKSFKFTVILCCLSVMFMLRSVLLASTPVEIPAKGMVTMVDIGKGQCIPCKMMAPILEKLKKEYSGRAAVIFIDIREDRTPAQRFGVRTIPTQIFFDRYGQEVFRHVGVMSEEDIVRRFKEMGVK